MSCWFFHPQPQSFLLPGPCEKGRKGEREILRTTQSSIKMASFGRHPTHPYNPHSRNPDPPQQHGQDMEMEMQPQSHGRHHGKIERGAYAPAEMGRPDRRGCNPFRALIIVLRSSSTLGACTNVRLTIPFPSTMA